MNIEKWINNNYQTLVENAKKITKDEGEAYDILHTCLESLLTYSQSRKNKIMEDGKLENYITKCVSIQYYSSTSPYHRKHRKARQNENQYIDYKHDIEEDNSDVEYLQQCECVDEELQNIFWYNKVLVEKKYLEGWTYNELHSYYGISKNALLKDIQAGLEMIKEKCKFNK